MMTSFLQTVQLPFIMANPTNHSTVSNVIRGHDHTLFAEIILHSVIVIKTTDFVYFFACDMQLECSRRKMEELSICITCHQQHSVAVVF